MKSYSAIISFLILGVATGIKHMNYNGEENTERDLDNLREFYRFLLQRNLFDNTIDSPISMSSSPYGHWMIRKSQRSPSLRLRFGRSGPAISPMNLLDESEPVGTRFDNDSIYT